MVSHSKEIVGQWNIFSTNRANHPLKMQSDEIKLQNWIKIIVKHNPLL